MAMRRRKRLWREVHASNAPEELTILERNGQVEVLEDAHAQATEIAAPPTPVPAMAEPQAQLAGRDAYPFGAQCTPCVCPGWELALYALILLERASDDGVDLNQLPFPEVDLHLVGLRRQELLRVARATLGSVLQTLRRLALEHMPKIREFAELLPAWGIRDVSMQPEALHRFLMNVYSRNPRYCRNRARRWTTFRPGINLILADTQLRQLLYSVHCGTIAALGAVQLPPGVFHWWELWSDQFSDKLGWAFISDVRAGSHSRGAAVPAGSSCTGNGLGQPTEEVRVRLAADVSQLTEEVSQLKEELAEAREALLLARQGKERSE